MDEEILRALKKAGAADQESGLTFRALLDGSGVNYDSFLGSIRRLRDKGLVESSDNKTLMTKAHPDPSGAVGTIEIRSEDYHGAIAKNKMIWAERNHYPLVIWLGDELAQELLDRKRADAILEEMRRPKSSVIVHGDNSGQIAVGDGNKQEQQSGGQSLRDSELSAPLIQNPVNNATAIANKRSPLEIASWIGGSIGGLWILWQVIKSL